MNFAVDLLISVVSLVVVGQFALALRTHFTSPKMSIGAQVISLAVVLATIGFLFLLWRDVQPVWAQIAGLGIELAGTALFWWAVRASRKARLRFAFDEEHPDSLLTSGPYRIVRHPFYTSYLLFWIGWGVAVWSPWAVLVVAIMLVLYVRAALMEERKFSLSPLASDYAVYRRRAGLFWPRITG
jgi:protein-S-isoprenylcysteine O-methyltransferase Ste14